MWLVLSAALVGLALAATPTTIHPKVGGDIRTNPLLARPLTVMERVLIRLERNAEGIAEDMGRPNYSDKHKPNVHSGAWAAVGIDNKTGRIVAQTIIAIDSIDDPWEDVCRQILKRHVTVYYTMDFSRGLWAAVLFDQIQAPREEKAAAYLQMMNSILVQLMFVGEDRAMVCEYDARTKQYNFVEHR
jgi:hypothetical protein